MDANLLVTLTSTTCGLACWHAAEDVCRCSCGGKNHGILNHGGAQPERQAKIGGKVYRLVAVGPDSDIRKQAFEYNWFGDYHAGKLRRYQAIDRPASESQMRWPECANFDYHGHKPSLLWIPAVSDDKAQESI